MSKSSTCPLTLRWRSLQAKKYSFPYCWNYILTQCLGRFLSKTSLDSIPVVCALSLLDIGLSHMTYIGQWNIGGQDTGKSLKSVWAGHRWAFLQSCLLTWEHFSRGHWSKESKSQTQQTWTQPQLKAKTGMSSKTHMCQVSSKCSQCAPWTLGLGCYAGSLEHWLTVSHVPVTTWSGFSTVKSPYLIVKLCSLGLFYLF